MFVLANSFHGLHQKHIDVNDSSKPQSVNGFVQKSMPDYFKPVSTASAARSNSQIQTGSEMQITNVDVIMSGHEEISEDVISARSKLPDENKQPIELTSSDAPESEHVVRRSCPTPTVRKRFGGKAPRKPYIFRSVPILDDSDSVLRSQ